MRITAIIADLIADIREVARGTEAPHTDLRHRLTAAIVATLVVDVIATLLIFWIERGHAQSDIHSLWDAFYFTTAQMVTVGASFSNPVTTAGQALCLLIDIYAITIVSTIAGMFGAFFYHRSVQRHGPPGKHGSGPERSMQHDQSHESPRRDDPHRKGRADHQ